MGRYSWINYFILNMSTYVDEIKMATYKFILDIKHDDELYRRWECEQVDIIHGMPNQFIALMNKWSHQIVSKFDDERNKREIEVKAKKKEKYLAEERIINKYR